MTSFSDAEIWHWHAYDYAWRHGHFGEDRFKPSPIDPTGKWWNDALFRVALTVMKTKPPPSIDQTVRPDFRTNKDIHVRDWTAAELQLAVNELDDDAERNGFGRGRASRSAHVASLMKAKGLTMRIR